MACIEALGLAGTAPEYSATGPSKLQGWAKTVADAPSTDGAVMVSTALDRAEHYLSALILADAPAAKGLAADLHKLCKLMGRPMTADALAAAEPSCTIALRLRVMTGDQLAVSVPVGATVSDVLSMAMERVESGKEKERTLNYEGKRLPPTAILKDFRIVDGAMLHLILTPPAIAEGKQLARGRSVDQVLAAAKQEEDGLVRCYGLQKGTSTPFAEKTLYARCGGIFGVAAFVDRCMDAWMADPTLNANDAIATWHHRAQRCGFKFLVTQLMGYLCGGPQVYTGRDMVAAHKHLAITEEEWGSFIDAMHEVCDEMGLPETEVP